LSRLVVPIRASVCLYALSTNNLSQLRGVGFSRKLQDSVHFWKKAKRFSNA
jgi:hypothetical protein